MNSVDTLIHQFEGSIRKIDRAKTDGEISFETYQALFHLLHASKVLVLEEKKKHPNGLTAPPKEEITITGMHLYQTTDDPNE